jgi:hypothetical protein
MLGQMRQALILGGLLCAGLLCAALPLIAADQTINLDRNTTNGEESRVSTRVLSTYPVRIENTIYNNAPGEAFTFRWPGAGPGGFSSLVTAGPGVGTIWTWTTVYQVYSIDSPITFTPVRSLNVFGSPTGGVLVPSGNDGLFSVPGKSIVPNDVTLSSASLTSSLITFFSPEKTVASCGVDCSAGGCEVFLENQTGGTVTMLNEQQDCCLEEHQIFCEGICTSYLTDAQNCGACGNVCAFDEFCGEGVCQKICQPGEEYCDEVCVDPLTDPLHCGGCGNTCGAAEFCDAGTCRPTCELTVCGDLCVDTQADPLNCGACGNACAADQFCGAGACQDICPGGELCGEVCVDPLTDPLNCGGCGIACDTDEFCDVGACRLVCDHTVCGELCVDLSSDPLNCGVCGNFCAYKKF